MSVDQSTDYAVIERPNGSLLQQTQLYTAQDGFVASGIMKTFCLDIFLVILTLGCSFVFLSDLTSSRTV